MITVGIANRIVKSNFRGNVATTYFKDGAELCMGLSSVSRNVEGFELTFTTGC